MECTMVDPTGADPVGADPKAAQGEVHAASDTKACPFCGEEIKKVAVRCKHCQADLSKAPAPDFDRGVEPGGPAAKPMDDFEVRFLEFAYKTTERINVPSVAYALKLPTAQVSDRLEDMAARDVLTRDVDDEGNVFFTVPGHATPRAPAGPPLARVVPPGPVASISGPADATAVAALVLNVVIPGTGSLIAGRAAVGVTQLMLWVIGVPLSFVLIGIPLAMAAWIWSLVTGIHILEESKRRSAE
jgi:TM2 domain-containing membrane protein YozV